MIDRGQKVWNPYKLTGATLGTIEYLNEKVNKPSGLKEFQLPSKRQLYSLYRKPEQQLHVSADRYILIFMSEHRALKRVPGTNLIILELSAPRIMIPVDMDNPNTNFIELLAQTIRGIAADRRLIVGGGPLSLVFPATSRYTTPVSYFTDPS